MVVADDGALGDDDLDLLARVGLLERVGTEDDQVGEATGDEPAGQGPLGGSRRRPALPNVEERDGGGQGRVEVRTGALSAAPTSIPATDSCTPAGSAPRSASR